MILRSINPNIKSVLKDKNFEIKALDYYFNGIVNDRNFLILSEAITLLESDAPQHQLLIDQLLIKCTNHQCKSKRIGITGSPGVGKSTFIESIAESFASKEQIAVLTIDPSSSDNRGSILGDKTRMNEITKNDHIFIRPSPSRTHLGGTSAMTYEAIALCEAAGFSMIIVETVGVGQSEHEIKNLVDCTLLLLLPGAGDDLQGIKKGITEIADIIIIHKSDGDRVELAKQIQKDYQKATHVTQNSESPWRVPVHRYSSINHDGRAKLFDSLESFFKTMSDIGLFNKRRRAQQTFLLKNRLINYYTKELIERIDNLVELKHWVEKEHIDQHLFKKLSQLKNHYKLELNQK